MGENGCKQSFPFLLWPGNGSAIVFCYAEVPLVLVLLLGPGVIRDRYINAHLSLINMVRGGCQSTSSR